MDKDRVIEILQEIAVLLELKGENPFKSRAYVSAARALESVTERIEDLIREGRLGQVKGVGEALQKKICELVSTGRLAYYEDLRASVPAGLFDLLQIPGLGPKKVKVLFDKLGCTSMEQLEALCRDGKVAVLDGFGEKTQAKIIEGIRFRCAHASRHLLVTGLAAAEPILDRLRQHPGVIRCQVAGSLRRWKEVIGDLDFVVSSKQPLAVLDFFVSQPEVTCINGKGETKASVVLGDGLQADLRVVTDAEYPTALAYFTGSKEHNIVMRQRAIQRGLRLNEYGLFRSKEETRDEAFRVPCETEEALYRELGLAYVPPELREDQGEFAAAEADRIPRLLEWTELRGSLHNHSNWSDGRNSLEEIASAIEDLGCEYWAVTDHSKSSVQARGLQPARLREQIHAVTELNRRLEDQGSDLRLLTGSEVDILSEGRLDFDDDLMSELQVVVASIHQGFTQSESETTRRLIRAAENRWVHMLGHLTGRLLLERNAYKVNQRAVIDACAETGTWIELNASPYRLDMDWRLWQYAQSRGVQCVINCDAHRLEHAGFLRIGAGVARKGWLRREDVVNTQPRAELMKALSEKRARA